MRFFLSDRNFLFTFLLRPQIPFKRRKHSEYSTRTELIKQSFVYFCQILSKRSFEFFLKKQKMRIRIAELVQILALIAFLAVVQKCEAWACRDTCGNLDVKYPFGTGPGCGDPRFANSVSCVNQKLMFTSRSGSYPIQSIDYDRTTILVVDPRMSTCSSMQPSGSFGLDANAPFKFKNDAFVLLGCSPSSPAFDAQNYLCDTGSVSVCRGLYACPGISGLGAGASQYAATACCVYTPTNLGSATEVNLQKLGCESYTSIYSFGDDMSDPQQWRYGIALQYNFNLDNSKFPSACVDCEQSHGVCGYSGAYNSFACVCRNGVNTTNNCYGQEYWNGANSQRYNSMGTWIAGIVMALFGSFVWTRL